MLLRTRNLTLKYKNKIIVNDLNINFPIGKITTICGLNGAGKSTILKALSNNLKPFSGNVLLDDVEIRIEPDQNMYIINLNENEALEVLEKTNFGAKNVFETSVSCFGATICQVGLRDFKGLLLKLVEGLRKYDFANGTLPRMHISGCPSSCGTHQMGLLGFRGSVKLVDKIPTPAFTMYVYGNDLLTKERFGKELGTVGEDEILAMLVEIAKSVQANKTNFEDWYNNNEEVFNSIVSKYTA